MAAPAPVREYRYSMLSKAFTDGTFECPKGTSKIYAIPTTVLSRDDFQALKVDAVFSRVFNGALAAQGTEVSSLESPDGRSTIDLKFWITGPDATHGDLTIELTKRILFTCTPKDLIFPSGESLVSALRAGIDLKKGQRLVVLFPVVDGEPMTEGLPPLESPLFLESAFVRCGVLSNYIFTPDGADCRQEKGPLFFTIRPTTASLRIGFAESVPVPASESLDTVHESAEGAVVGEEIEGGSMGVDRPK